MEIAVFLLAGAIKKANCIMQLQARAAKLAPTKTIMQL
jgi:hypothetical protein